MPLFCYGYFGYDLRLWPGPTAPRREKRVCRARDVIPSQLTFGHRGLRSVVRHIQAMAVADLLADSLAKGSSDVRYLLSSHNVEENSQAKLFENGIDTLARFAAFVRSEDDLRC